MKYLTCCGEPETAKCSCSPRNEQRSDCDFPHCTSCGKMVGYGGCDNNECSASMKPKCMNCGVFGRDLYDTSNGLFIFCPKCVEGNLQPVSL